METPSLPQSDHFTLVQAGSGVYLAVANPEKFAIGNAGIVDLGRLTIVFDTFESLQAARELRQAAIQLTGRPPGVVINSHGHPDHWLGNQFFPEAAIFSTRAAREEMIAYLDEVANFQLDPKILQQDIENTEECLAQEEDPIHARILSRWSARLRNQLSELHDLAPRLPEITLDSRLDLHGPQRTALVITLGRGHTSGDCLLYLPEDHVLFTGDLAFFGRQPFMPDSDPLAWAGILAELESWDVSSFLPGHGLPGTRNDLMLQREYMSVIKGIVLNSVTAGETIETILHRRLPAPFDQWPEDGFPMEANVRMFYPSQG
jgi:glyoxylase-like metal-dependent hydrolase (beta-lactamase superfamily II)